MNTFATHLVLITDIIGSFIPLIGLGVFLTYYRQQKKQQHLLWALFFGILFALAMSNVFIRILHNFGVDSVLLVYLLKSRVFLMATLAYSLWSIVTHQSRYKGKGFLSPFFLVCLLAGAIYLVTSQMSVQIQGGVILPVIDRGVITLAWIILDLVTLLFIIKHLQSTTPNDNLRKLEKAQGWLFLGWLLLQNMELITVWFTALPLGWFVGWIGSAGALVFMIGLISALILPYERELSQRPFHYLRSKFIVKIGFSYIIMVLIFVEGISLVSLTLTKKELLTLKKTQLHEKLERTQPIVYQYYSGSEKSLVALGRSQELNTADLNVLNIRLKNIANGSKRFAALAIFDANGKLLAEGPMSGELHNIITFMSTHIADYLLRKNQHLFRDHLHNQYYIIGTPISGNRILVGVLAYALLEKQFSDMSNDIYMLQNTSKLILATTKADKQTLLTDTYLTEQSALEHTSGLVLIIGQTYENVFKEVAKAEKNSMLLVVVCSYLALLLGVLLAGSIEKPMRRILLGINIIEGGDLTYRIPIKGIDEMAKLSRSFNEMAVKLSAMQTQLVEMEKTKVLGQITTTVNHEINSPLASILMTVQLMKKILVKEHDNPSSEYPGILLDKMLNFATMLEKEADHIKEIIYKLKDVKNIETAEYLPGHSMLKLRDGAGLE